MVIPLEFGRPMGESACFVPRPGTPVHERYERARGRSPCTGVPPGIDMPGCDPTRFRGSYVGAGHAPPGNTRARALRACTWPEPLHRRATRH